MKRGLLCTMDQCACCANESDIDSMFYHIMNAKLYFCICWEIVVGSSDKPICPGPLPLPCLLQLMCKNEKEQLQFIQAGISRFQEGDLTQDVSKCEKILDMKKKKRFFGPSDRSGTFSNFSHFLVPMDGSLRNVYMQRVAALPCKHFLQKSIEMS